MERNTAHEALRMLKRIRSELSRDARGRARDRADELIARLEREASEEGSRQISTRELLKELSKLIPALGSIAELVHAMLKKL